MEDKKRQLDRPVAELLVLMITVTVCASIILTTLAVLLIRIWAPSQDISPLVNSLGDTITALIGLVAGFGFGRAAAIKKNGNGKNGTTKPDQNGKEPQ